MGLSSVKFENISKSNDQVYDIKNILINNATNMKNKLVSILNNLNRKILESYISVPDSYDPDSQINKDFKNRIVTELLILVKQYYSDELAMNLSTSVLQQLSDNLQFGININSDELKELNEKRTEIDGNVRESQLKDTFSTRVKLAEEIVSLLIDRLLISNQFQYILENKDSEYMRDFEKMKQLNENLTKITDNDLKDEIKYRFEVLNNSLSEVYQDINNVLMDLKEANSKDEVDKIKLEFGTKPNNKINKFCKNLDNVCDLIDIDKYNEDDMKKIKKIINKTTRNQTISNVCEKEYNQMFLNKIDKLKSPCNNERLDISEKMYDEIEKKEKQKIKDNLLKKESENKNKEIEKKKIDVNVIKGRLLASPDIQTKKSKVKISDKLEIIKTPPKKSIKKTTKSDRKRIKYDLKDFDLFPILKKTTIRPAIKKGLSKKTYSLDDYLIKDKSEIGGKYNLIRKKQKKKPMKEDKLIIQKNKSEPKIKTITNNDKDFVNIGLKDKTVDKEDKKEVDKEDKKEVDKEEVDKEEVDKEVDKIYDEKIKEIKVNKTENNQIKPVKKIREKKYSCERKTKSNIKERSISKKW